MELIRIIIISILGAILMFWIQPFLYKQGLIWEPNIQNPQTALENWVSLDYTPAAFWVFGVSVVCTIVWYIMTSKSQAHRPNEINQWQLYWWLIGLLPLISIGLGIGFFNKIPEPRLSLAFFFLVDILILYWLTTATSTPGLLMYTPPLAAQLRDLLSRLGVND